MPDMANWTSPNYLFILLAVIRGTSTSFMNKTTLSIFAIQLYCHANGLIAQPSEDNFLKAISECAVIENPAQRYACFDDLTSHLRNEQNSAEQVHSQESDIMPFELVQEENVEASEIADNETSDIEGSATPATIEEFGNRNTRLEVDEAGQATLHDRIVSLREREPNQFLITLESGQVWYQTINKRFRLREGMSVIIAPSPVGGSYRLSSPDASGFIQVRRIE
jgi:hypothetical protein